MKALKTSSFLRFNVSINAVNLTRDKMQYIGIYIQQFPLVLLMANALGVEIYVVQM